MIAGSIKTWFFYSSSWKTLMVGFLAKLSWSWSHGPLHTSHTINLHRYYSAYGKGCFQHCHDWWCWRLKSYLWILNYGYRISDFRSILFCKINWRREMNGKYFDVLFNTSPEQKIPSVYFNPLHRFWIT